MTYGERLDKAYKIKEWLDGAQPGHSAEIIRALLLIAEQNEEILKRLEK